MRWFLFPVVTATRKFMQAATNILVREFIFWNLTIPTPSGGRRLSITEFITLDEYQQTRWCIHLWEYWVLIQQMQSNVLLIYKKCCFLLMQRYLRCVPISLFYWKIHESCFGVMIKILEVLYFSNLYFFPCKKTVYFSSISCLWCWINEGVVYTYIF